MDIRSTIGAREVAKQERAQNDFYATPPETVRGLLNVEFFSKDVLEPACGAGHIAKVLTENGHNVVASDLVYRGYGLAPIDFLQAKEIPDTFDIITNPPFNLAEEFIRKAFDLLGKHRKAAMLLPLRYLEGKKRRDLFDQIPPRRVWVSSSRICCARNGEFETSKQSNAMAFAWFVWEKDWIPDLEGRTELGWFN